MSMHWKRNWWVVAVLLWFLVFTTLLFGNQRVIAYTSSSRVETDSQSIDGQDYENEIDLFDDRLVHHVQVKMDEADYQQMISAYQNMGEKEYFPADIIVDGVQVSEVGIRLKGNASLRTALGGGMKMNRVERADEQQGRPDFPTGQNWPMSMPPGGPGGGQKFQPGASDIQNTGTVKIPFMIKFDAFVDGQSYQGHSAIAIRNYGVNYDAAMLNEPVTNDMARLVGLPATRTSYVGFGLNGADEQLYVISELVNQEYVAQYFENSHGVLYKAELGSSLSYLGEEPSAYENSFTQQTRVNDADMAPLIAFSRFLSESDDETFEQELAAYLNVDSFATYLALSNLLVNIDSIAGMNNNYYLYYDDVEDRFTLLMWDTNESLGGLGVRMGDLDGVASYNLYYEGQQVRPNGLGGGQNILVKRFLSSAVFRALYEEKLKFVYQEVFVSGAIQVDLEHYVKLIESVNQDEKYASAESYEQSVQVVRDFLAQRVAYLQGTELLGNP